MNRTYTTYTTNKSYRISLLRLRESTKKTPPREPEKRFEKGGKKGKGGQSVTPSLKMAISCAQFFSFFVMISPEAAFRTNSTNAPVSGWP